MRLNLPLRLSLLLFLFCLSLSENEQNVPDLGGQQLQNDLNSNQKQIIFSSEDAETVITSTQEKRFKVCVYAIAKNEEDQVESFMSWAKYADDVYILDTGSTDRTVERFKGAGAKVASRVFSPFRFDWARNSALNLLPPSCQIAVTADLDNIYTPESQWRSILENIWASNNINRLDFPWFYDVVQFPTYSNYDKKYIHSRYGFSWEFPIHEKLLPNEGVEIKSIVTEEIQLLEYPKPGVRKTYTPFLELAVKEYPDSAAHHLWLALDYHAQGRYVESIEEYIKHLGGGTLGFEWVQSPHVRAFSKRTIAKAYWQSGDLINAEHWYKEAIKEHPKEREVWNDLATFYLMNNRFMESYLTAHHGWQVPIELRRWDWPVDDCAWTWCLPSLLGRASYELKLYRESCFYSKLSYDFAHNDIDKQVMDSACAIPVPDPTAEFPLS